MGNRSHTWPNNITIRGDEAFMDLTNTEGEVVATTVFDAVCILKVLAHGRRWSLCPSTKRVVSSVDHEGRDLRILLHRVIMRPPSEMEIDHVDRNPLNNRISNLRVVTGSQNCQNKVARRDSTTGIKNVYRYAGSRTKPFVAMIQVAGKRLYLGRFADLESAAEAVRVATLEHHTHSPGMGPEVAS